MRVTPLTNRARRAYRRHLRGPRRTSRITRLERAMIDGAYARMAEEQHFVGLAHGHHFGCLYCLGETFSQNGEILGHG